MRIGDRVHLESRPDVKGEIVEIHPDWSYPVSVRWDGDTKHHTYSASRLRIVPAVDLLADLIEDPG